MGVARGSLKSSQVASRFNSSHMCPPNCSTNCSTLADNQIPNSHSQSTRLPIMLPIPNPNPQSTTPAPSPQLPTPNSPRAAASRHALRSLVCCSQNFCRVQAYSTFSRIPPYVFVHCLCVCVSRTKESGLHSSLHLRRGAHTTAGSFSFSSSAAAPTVFPSRCVRTYVS
jgi:hypothetical protein